ncbi:putative Transferase family-domain-containing protein [Seiridium cardinale]|uniref:Transferase family-domain-containing protein n=1 Tax=Seiridium cardinale TaxID=138064 RepID=A0ABR2Y5R4_9PEZI
MASTSSAAEAERDTMFELAKELRLDNDMASTSSATDTSRDGKGKAKAETEEELMFQFAQRLRLVHNLSAFDQSVSREYVRYMFLFDFPVVSQTTVEHATAAVRRGLEVAFTYYPFLTGMLGPVDPTTCDRVLLRYGDTEVMRQIRDEIFKVRIQKHNPLIGDYERLCKAGMPTSCLAMEDYCATKPDWKLPRWIPVLALQMNFLDDSGLILCLAIQHSVADTTSIDFFLNVFATGIRGEFTKDTAGVYHNAGIDSMFEAEVNERASTVLPKEIAEWDLAGTGSPPQNEADSHIMAMSATLVREMQRRINKCLEDLGVGPHSVSATECIYALLLVYITRARHLSPPMPSDHDIVFTTAINIRNKFGDDAMLWQFGNVIATVATVQRAGEIISKDRAAVSQSLKYIAFVAYKIRYSNHTFTRDSILNRLTILSNMKNPAEIPVAANRACLPAVSGVKFESLANLGADIDFGIPGTINAAGDRRPRGCRRPWMHDMGTINILPRKGGTEGDADWEILLCFPDKVMQIFTGPEEFGQFLRGYVLEKDPTTFWRRWLLGVRRLYVEGTERTIYD